MQGSTADKQFGDLEKTMTIEKQPVVTDVEVQGKLDEVERQNKDLKEQNEDISEQL